MNLCIICAYIGLCGADGYLRIPSELLEQLIAPPWHPSVLACMHEWNMCALGHILQLCQSACQHITPTPLNKKMVPVSQAPYIFLKPSERPSIEAPSFLDTASSLF